MILLYKFRYGLLLGTLLACVMLWQGVQSALVVDNSLTVWFLKNDPALVSYRSFQKKFGNDEVVVLVLKDKQTALSAANLKRFVTLTRALEAIPEVAGVTGPGNMQVPVREQLGVFSRPLIPADADPVQVRQTLSRLPTLRAQLFSDDYKAAGAATSWNG
jgi:predicted RND superfamily exporter protein